MLYLFGGGFADVRREHQIWRGRGLFKMQSDGPGNDDFISYELVRVFILFVLFQSS